MHDRSVIHPRRLFERAAQIAFAFVMMNSAAVMGLFCALFRRKVWR